jgi:ParB family chromosome partitioning protein
MKTNPREVQLIPISRIRVLNPRLRDEKKFVEIIENIKTIGLKRPITVRILAGSKPGEETYEVVCGQGRFEAFKAAGVLQIPAIVQSYDRKEALLASLIENVARRPVRAIEQIESVRWMHSQGHSAAAIEKKTGLGESYVKGILRLLDQGEERLLDAALHGRVPITIAIRISESKNDDVQRILMDAYESGEIKQSTLSQFRRLVQMRKCWGKSYGQQCNVKHPKKNSSQIFLSRYRQLAERHRLLIKKARAAEARLLSISAAFRTLMADENFVHALRSEGVGTMPKFLSERMKEAI